MGSMIKLANECSTQPPNPDPYNFRLVRSATVGKYTIALVHYPDCTTFKGNKILVFDRNIEEVLRMSRMDPHFLDDDTALIARFPGSYMGWEDAWLFTKSKIIS